ncbi:MAG: hypothetical protein DIU69_08940 [Bacillota bacterium]|nr:MAG: hypothetical protein DIU69_08940 [Bacillota bacterium]
MHAVVSLLDQSHYEKVEALWSELASRFGLRGIYRTPYPHFSCHVAAGTVDYYHPESWVPHITLAEHDLDAATAGRAVEFLLNRDLYWEVIIDNVALIDDTGTRQELRLRFDLRG